MAFRVWLLSVGVIFPSFVQAVVCILLHSLLWLSNTIARITPVSLPTHPLMAIGVASASWHCIQ